jgi:hypothetical protein
MPVDADPHPDGTITLIPAADGGATAHVLQKFESAGWAPRYRSHFATCPNASDWRRSRVTWVRLADVSSRSDWAELLATAMEELAIAWALVMIHGDQRGAKQYIQAGGRVRFDDDGEPVIWAAS